MKRFLKWVGIVVGALLVVVLAAFLIVYFVAGSRLNRTYTVAAKEINVPSDAATLARGEHLVTIFGCTSCHGANLAGDTFMEDPVIAHLYASNLTTGAGGVAGEYSDAQLARAIRSGIDTHDKSLLFMPSQDYSQLSDADTAAIIAYIRSIPPVDHVQPANTVGPLGRVLSLAGVLPLQVADLANHASVGAEPPPAGPTAAYGAYLAPTCRGCHMANLAGGTVATTVPSSNLTPGGELANWTAQDFIQTMRTGINPQGRQLDPEMPYEAIGRMSDDELTALFLYLQTLPAVKTNS